MSDRDPGQDGARVFHATAIAVDAGGGPVAVLCRGPSGAGKSDLALRAIGAGASPLVGSIARLVADDQVLIRRCEARLVVSPPAPIAGLIEVRGLGVVAVPYVPEARLALVADLTPGAPPDRMPEGDSFIEIMGVRVPALALDPYAASAHLVLLLALSRHSARLD